MLFPCANIDLFVLINRFLSIIILFYLLRCVATQSLLVLGRLIRSCPPLEVVFVRCLLLGYALW